MDDNCHPRRSGDSLSPDRNDEVQEPWSKVSDRKPPPQNKAISSNESNCSIHENNQTGSPTRLHSPLLPDESLLLSQDPLDKKDRKSSVPSPSILKECKYSGRNDSVNNSATSTSSGTNKKSQNSSQSIKKLEEHVRIKKIHWPKDKSLLETIFNIPNGIRKPGMVFKSCKKYVEKHVITKEAVKKNTEEMNIDLILESVGEKGMFCISIKIDFIMS